MVLERSGVNYQHQINQLREALAIISQRLAELEQHPLEVSKNYPAKDSSHAIPEETVSGLALITQGNGFVEFDNVAAEDVTVDASGFTGNLSGTDTDVQTALGTIDGIAVGTGDVVGPASATDSNLCAFDTTTGKLIKDSGCTCSDFAPVVHTHAMDEISVLEVGTATYDDAKDWLDVTQGAGRISGGDITDAGSGQVSVAAGTGMIKVSTAATSEIRFFDIPATTPISLTDNDENYIYCTYGGGTPAVAASVTNLANGRTIFNIGRVFRSGTDLCIFMGPTITELSKQTHRRLVEVDGFVIASGATIAEVPTRSFSLTASILYQGLARTTTSSYNSSSTQFYYHYHSSGAWTYTGSNTIDNLYYDDGTNLHLLTSNRYGVHWVYLHYSGHVSVVYGRGNYVLAQALAATPPTDLPECITDFAALAAKIIVKKSQTSFYSLVSYVQNTASPSAVTDHGDLAGLSDNDHPQYALVSGTTNNTFTIDSDSALGKIIIDVLTGAADKSITITNETLTADRTVTFQDLSGTVALTSELHSQNTDTGTTSNTFDVDTDSGAGMIRLKVTTGGDYTITLTHTGLTANRTITFPDNTGTVAIASSVGLSDTFTADGFTWTVENGVITSKA